jgi:hypothetical protein
MSHLESMKNVGFYHGRVYLNSQDSPETKEHQGIDSQNLTEVFSKNAYSAEDQVAQLVFLYSGDLQLDMIPTPTRYFYLDQGLFECDSKGKHDDTRYTLPSGTIEYARRLRRSIISVAYDWVTIFLALQSVTPSSSRIHRIEQWKAQLSAAGNLIFPAHK